MQTHDKDQGPQADQQTAQTERPAPQAAKERRSDPTVPLGHGFPTDQHYLDWKHFTQYLE